MIRWRWSLCDRNPRRSRLGHLPPEGLPPSTAHASAVGPFSPNHYLGGLRPDQPRAPPSETCPAPPLVPMIGRSLEDAMQSLTRLIRDAAADNPLARALEAILDSGMIIFSP